MKEEKIVEDPRTQDTGDTTEESGYVTRGNESAVVVFMGHLSGPDLGAEAADESPEDDGAAAKTER